MAYEVDAECRVDAYELVGNDVERPTSRKPCKS